MRRLTCSVAVLGAVAAATVVPSAETHRFVPQAYYDVPSAVHAPALRIKNGDTVSTTTVDAGAVGADGKATSSLTGPFYVETAEPGDLLVITIDRIAPNSTIASSSPIITAQAVEAKFSSNRDATRVPWTIDSAKGVVRLDLSVFRGVDWKTRFSPATIEFPMTPSLASISVAPPTVGAWGAERPGGFGGQLNYAGITTGMKVMLPVSAPGALLFLGRGQVRQGDGMVTGAVETSMDVDFTVTVVKKKDWPHSSVIRPSTVVGEFEMDYPRLENDTHIMAVGIAPSLQQALQRATLELHHWIDDDFGLNERAVSVFMGQAIEYEIASMSDTTFTVVAKVRKSYIPKPIQTP